MIKRLRKIIIQLLKRKTRKKLLIVIMLITASNNSKYSVSFKDAERSVCNVKMIKEKRL